MKQFKRAYSAWQHMYNNGGLLITLNRIVDVSGGLHEAHKYDPTYIWVADLDARIYFHVKAGLQAEMRLDVLNYIRGINMQAAINNPKWMPEDIQNGVKACLKKAQRGYFRDMPSWGSGLKTAAWNDSIDIPLSLFYRQITAFRKSEIRAVLSVRSRDDFGFIPICVNDSCTEITIMNNSGHETTPMPLYALYQMANPETFLLEMRGIGIYDEFVHIAKTNFTSGFVF